MSSPRPGLERVLRWVEVKSRLSPNESESRSRPKTFNSFSSPSLYFRTILGNRFRHIMDSPLEDNTNSGFEPETNAQD